MPVATVSLLNNCCSEILARNLKPELLHKLEGLFAFYHRQWWLCREMFYHFKRRHGFLNALALLIVAAGIIAGAIFENSIVVASLTAAGTLVKGWNDFKKFSFKVDMCRFAYVTYEKTLTELRSYVRGLPMDEFDGFLIKLQTLDDVIADFTPPVSDYSVQEYNRRFRYVHAKDLSFTVNINNISTV